MKQTNIKHCQIFFLLELFIQGCSLGRNRILKEVFKNNVREKRQRCYQRGPRISFITFSSVSKVNLLSDSLFRCYLFTKSLIFSGNFSQLSSCTLSDSCGLSASHLLLCVIVTCGRSLSLPQTLQSLRTGLALNASAPSTESGT